jgi:hypothetical protein
MNLDKISALSSLASGFAAWIALALSVYSIYLNRRSIDLAEDIDRRTRPNIAIYIHEGVIRRNTDRNVQTVCLLVLLSNTSDSPISIRDMEFRLTISNNTDKAFTFRKRLNAKSYVNSDGSSWIVPLYLSPLESKQSWAYFEFLEKETIVSHAIRKEIIVTDSLSAEYAADVMHLRELVDAPAV